MYIICIIHMYTYIHTYMHTYIYVYVYVYDGAASHFGLCGRNSYTHMYMYMTARRAISAFEAEILKEILKVPYCIFSSYD
jgi:hypothetical protein